MKIKKTIISLKINHEDWVAAIIQKATALSITIFIYVQLYSMYTYISETHISAPLLVVMDKRYKLWLR